MIYTKWQPDPRQLSSDWISRNIVKGNEIGIENIPLYQLLPDSIVEEFYSKNYQNNRFKYRIIDSKTLSLPRFVIVTNEEFNLNYLKVSEEKDLIARLNREKYKKIEEFKPSGILYKVMGSDFALYSSGIVPVATISVYKQDKNPQN